MSYIPQSRWSGCVSDFDQFRLADYDIPDPVDHFIWVVYDISDTADQFRWLEMKDDISTQAMNLKIPMIYIGCFRKPFHLTIDLFNYNSKIICMVTT